VFSFAAAKRLHHTLYIEVSRFSQPLEGGFGEQLLNKVRGSSIQCFCHPEEAEG
jgi:hypothetical protein